MSTLCPPGPTGEGDDGHADRPRGEDTSTNGGVEEDGDCPQSHRTAERSRPEPGQSRHRGRSRRRRPADEHVPQRTAILAFRVVRFDRWLPHTDPDVVLEEVAQICRRFHIRWIAADGGGNGQVYNRLLLKRIEQLQRRPALYSIYYSTDTLEPVRDGVLLRWTVNRSRHIGAVFSRIKTKLISFPRVQESGSYLDEFVCELAEYDELMRTIKYTKPETQRDDALHATVYAETLALRMAAALPY